MRRRMLTPPITLARALAVALGVLLSTAAVAGAPKTPAASATKAPTAAEAKAFIERVNADLKTLSTKAARADWVKNTYITDDTEILSAEAAEALMVYTAEAIKEAARFNDVKGLDKDTARALHLLKIAADLPAPNDPKKTTELAKIASQMTSLYGKGKSCTKDKSGKETCRDLEELSKVMGTSRDYEELKAAWNGWHSISPEIKPLFQRYVELVNEGSKNLGFADTGALWKSRYDMTPQRVRDRDGAAVAAGEAALRATCTATSAASSPRTTAGQGEGRRAHPRAPARQHVGPGVGQHLRRSSSPTPGQASLDVTAAPAEEGHRRAEDGEDGRGVLHLLGLKPLPASFWKRSMFTKPRDRDVVCHASRVGRDLRRRPHQDVHPGR
jgi:peptidyl-dipeptidase A